MPNVLILGGTGYLGLTLGHALLRTGNFTVFGTARTPEKAKSLIAAEITPLSGDITDPATLSSLITNNEIHIVVDASQAYEQAGSILTGVVTAAKNRIAALAKESAVGPKLGFVYTSGSWVHGSPSARVSDLSPVGNSLAKGTPATAVGWRPAHEQAILKARDVLDVAILRPAAIYGRGSWVWGTWWGGLLAAKQKGSNEPIQVPADKTARTGTIHVDDLAAAYVAAIERIDGRLGNWPVFDVLNETISITEIMEAAKAALGVTAPLEYGGTHGNPFLEALSLVANSDASRARNVLGWEPRRKDFLQNMELYVKAWEAAQEAK